MEQSQVLSHIYTSGIVAVIRASSAPEAVEIAQACIEGGITAIELTFTTPEAESAISALSLRYAGNGILIGAGTVLDCITAEKAIAAGAAFLVSPHFDSRIITKCQKSQILAIPGIMTVREAVLATQAGAELLKLFPGELFGPDFIKALKGPLPNLRIMPTGGVSVENISNWVHAGAFAVGAGSLLTKGNVMENSRRFIKQMKKARKELS